MEKDYDTENEHGTKQNEQRIQKLLPRIMG